MIVDSDVQRLFQDMFQARHTVAVRQEELRVAKVAMAQAERDLEAAHVQLSDIERGIQRLAERAAGVVPREPEQESLQKLHSEFRPIHIR